MFTWLSDIWPYVVGTLTVFLALATATHVVLYKRDARAAAAWVGVVLLFPVLGAVLYFLLGINRIQRLATELRQERLRLEADTAEIVERHDAALARARQLGAEVADAVESTFAG